MENIAKALIKFQMEVGKISKDSNNPFFNSSYASLPHILDAIRAPLISCDLAVVQLPSGDGKLRTMLLHASGECIEDTFDMKLAKSDPQSLGSAITYARRYAIGAILNLNIDEDDDANRAMPTPVDKEWFNATNKKGEMTEDGINVCKAIYSGKRTWAQFYEKYKLSSKDKQAMLLYVDKLAQEAEA